MSCITSLIVASMARPRGGVVAEVVTRFTALADLPELLRVEEAATYLGISKGLAYELARRGELASVRLGRLLRIRREGLDLMVQK